MYDPRLDPRTLILMAGMLLLLGAATIAVRILQRQTNSAINPAILETFRRRVLAWWILFSTLAAALLLGKTATVVLFGLIAFWALREFITLTPTRPGDHRALFWVFFLCTPVQFVLVWMGWYSLFSILIPVYAFLLIPARIAMAGDCKRFLERTAKIQSGLLICVYCLSYAPALLTTLELPDKSPGTNARLLFFFVVIVQLSDALQYAWAQVPSRHVIVPTVSPTRTWEGLLGGTASVTITGTVAEINTALDGMAYRGNAEFNGAEVLTVAVNDQGNTGSGRIGFLFREGRYVFGLRIVSDASGGPAHRDPVMEYGNE